jgi:hypothetical protein
MTMDRVFAYWGLPDEIVSDRARINVASAWTHLLRLLGTRPLTTTAYHSRGNGQVERINLVLETMLRPYINTRQNDWDTYLGVVQMAYSTLQQTSTKVSPFYAAYGREPLSALSRPRTAQSKSPVAELRYDNLQRIHEQVRTALEIANAKHSKFFNRSIQDAPPYKVGDKVWLNWKHLHHARPSLKLDQQYYGPFKIKAATASLLVWELTLPPHLSLLHPKFHVTKLEPFQPGFRHQWQEPPCPVLLGKVRNADDDPLTEYYVENILDSHIREGGSTACQDDYEYLTSWVGYPSSDNLWQSYSSVKDVDIFREFKMKNINNPLHVFPKTCRKHLGLNPIVEPTCPKPPTPSSPWSDAATKATSTGLAPSSPRSGPTTHSRAKQVS